MEPNQPAAVTGGCQCGAVRYRIDAPLQQIHYCHCRMCQRAMGNLFAALAGAPKDALHWTLGRPRYFASSSVARRGFCERCGTPLTFAYTDAQRVYVSIGSLDHPEAAVPEIHYGIESRLPWLHIADQLPSAPTSDDPRLRDMRVYQLPTP
ncbi:MAG: GFA family protein [Gammaproteobacteria bacterium]|nr:GFA family protein [Gammaproteobacteria bacterium]